MTLPDINRIVKEILGESGHVGAVQASGGAWLGAADQIARPGALEVDQYIYRSLAIGCRIYKSGAVSVPDNTTQVIDFNTVRFDPLGMWAAGANTRITIRYPGVYLIASNVRFDDNTTGRRAINIRLNGTLTIASQAGLPTAAGMALQVATLYLLDEADYLETLAYQNSGGALNVSSTANYSPEFMAVRIA